MTYAWPSHMTDDEQYAYIVNLYWSSSNLTIFLCSLWLIIKYSNTSSTSWPASCLISSFPSLFFFNFYYSIPPSSCNIYLFFSSSILALMSCGCGQCGVQSFSLTATSPTGAPTVHQMPLWILNKPQDHLHASWSTAWLLPRYYSACGLRAPSGWMGFESAVLWAKLEIIGISGLSVWSLILSLVIIQPLVFLLAEVASEHLSKCLLFGGVPNNSQAA